jgi:hypothetical protein
MFDLDVICEALSIIHPDESANRQIINIDRYFYNCWGFTAYALDWNNQVRWLRQSEMEELLSICSEPVNEVNGLMVGDIAVFTDEHGLNHTAVLIKTDPQTFIHKNGSAEIYVLTSEEMENRYRCIYGKIKEFRRSTVVKKTLDLVA